MKAKQKSTSKHTEESLPLNAHEKSYIIQAKRSTQFRSVPHNTL